MKPVKPTIAIALIIFIIAACSKSDDNENASSGNQIACISSSFEVILNIDFKPVCVIEDLQSNIVMLGLVQGYINVLKINPYGNLLWQKSYPNLYGKPMNIIQTDGGYLVTSATMSFDNSWTGPISQVNVEVEYVLNSTNNYIPKCETMYDYMMVFEEPADNKLYIAKIEESGTLVEKTERQKCNFSPGNMISKFDDGTFLLAVFQYRGDGAELKDPWNPVVTFPRDENIVELIRVDQSGTPTLMSTIQHVLVFEWIDQILDGDVNFDLSINGDNYILNVPNKTYLVNPDGSILETYQPKYNFTGNHTHSMAFADETTNYFIGRVDFYNSTESEYYLMKADLFGNPVWYINIEEFDNARLTTADNGLFACIDRDDNYFLEKYDNNGQMIWQKPVGKNPHCFVSSCAGGIVYCLYDPLADQLSVIKTDENGNY